MRVHCCQNRAFMWLHRSPTKFSTKTLCGEGSGIRFPDVANGGRRGELFGNRNTVDDTVPPRVYGRDEEMTKILARDLGFAAIACSCLGPGKAPRCRCPAATHSCSGPAVRCHWTIAFRISSNGSCVILSSWWRWTMCTESTVRNCATFLRWLISWRRPWPRRDQLAPAVPRSHPLRAPQMKRRQLMSEKPSAPVRRSYCRRPIRVTEPKILPCPNKTEPRLSQS